MAVNTERRLAVEQTLASPSPLQLIFSTASFLCCKAALAEKTHVANRNKLANVRQATACDVQITKNIVPPKIGPDEFRICCQLLGTRGHQCNATSARWMPRQRVRGRGLVRYLCGGLFFAPFGDGKRHSIPLIELLTGDHGARPVVWLTAQQRTSK